MVKKNDTASDVAGLDALDLGLEADPDRAARARSWEGRRRANELDGQSWTRYSVSVWSDIKKNEEERMLATHHPAVFPEQLVRRAMDCFMAPGDAVVLDPFAGTGSTVVAAERSGRVGIGFELYEEFAAVAWTRLANPGLFDRQDLVSGSRIIQVSALDIRQHLEPESVDFVFTSPPYWDILSQRRSADYKETRDYGEGEADLGRMNDYSEFLAALRQVFEGVFEALRPGKYCVVNVMDLRKGDQFYPLHSDLARELVDAGYKWDDLIIWDRRHEYNNFRPLGYPSTFRINKAHEYLLVFLKPR